MMSVGPKLQVILADTYTLYLKTQNYHWHVHGIQFKSLHELFEIQYQDLALAVDALAERIVMLGHKAPASFKDFLALKTLKEGDAKLNALHMLSELAHDNGLMIHSLNEALRMAQDAHDEGTVALLVDRIAVHEKAHWMLSASQE